MDIVQILGIGLVAAIFSITIKKQQPEFAVLINIVAGIIIFIMVAEKIPQIISAFNSIMDRTKVDIVYFSTILKIIGIAYVTEFGSQICKDMGEGSIASKIELGGKVVIMVLGLPILRALTESILNILP